MQYTYKLAGLEFELGSQEQIIHLEQEVVNQTVVQKPIVNFTNGCRNRMVLIFSIQKLS